MALKAKLNTLDGLSEEIKAEYTESNGKFVLNVEAVDGIGLEDVTGLKKVKDEAIQGRDTLKGKLSDMETELSKLKRSNAELKAGQSGELDERIGTLKAELQALHQVELKAVADERDSFKTELETTIFDSSLKDVLVESGVTAKGLKYLPGELKPHVKFERTDGKTVLHVVDAKGNIRSSVAKPGESMSVAEFFKTEIAPDNLEFLVGNGQAGSGSHGFNGAGSGSVSGKTITETKFMSMPAKERASLLVNPETGESTGVQVIND